MARKSSFLLCLSVVCSLTYAVPSMAADAVCEPAKVSTKYPSLAGKTVKIGADPQTPPYVMRDKVDFNKIIGVDADLGRAVFDCAGLKYEFVLGAWSGVLPAVQSGQIDVMWDDLYYKPARAEVVDFVIYMQAATGALVQKGNPKKVAKIDDLCGLTVSFGVGSSNEVAVKKQNDACKSAQKSEINMMPFQDLAAGLRLIDASRADVIMWDLGFVDNLAATNSEKYARAFAIMDGLEIGAAVKKGNSELLQVIYDGMQVVQKSGQQKAIFQKYGVDPTLELPAVMKTK